MGLFNKLFNKDEKSTPNKTPKGFHPLSIKEVRRLTTDSVQLIFDVPSELAAGFTFVPGQYVDICVYPDGQEQRRSYSICSGKDEALSIAIKAVNPGHVSKWINQELKAGDEVLVSEPRGNFKLDGNARQVVAFAAGSGITPIMSMAKAIEQSGNNLRLYYANKTEADILFRSELDTLNHSQKNYYLSQQEKENFGHGRLNKDVVSGLIKSDLSLLKADAFYLCGPSEMISDITDLLHLFGVPKDKVHFELFSTPVEAQAPPAETTNWKGTSEVQVILDDEKFSLKLASDGKSILDAVSDAGYDAPYSCRGAVCCTCRAKVISGKATMTLNYSLTDQEVAEGFILTCQAHPASEKLVLSYDE